MLGIGLGVAFRRRAGAPGPLAGLPAGAAAAYVALPQYLWADVARTVPASVGGAVAVWDDATGNGRHATQPYAALRPTLYDAGGGRYELYFAGSQWMQCPAMPSRTVFAAVRHSDGATFADFRRVIDCGDADNWSLFGVSGEAAYNPGSYTRGFAVSALRINGVAKNPPSQVPLSDRRLLSFAADAQASSPVWLGCYAGVGQNLYGHLGAALVYPGVIADPDRAAAEAALMARYVS